MRPGHGKSAVTIHEHGQQIGTVDDREAPLARRHHLGVGGGDRSGQHHHVNLGRNGIGRMPHVHVGARSPERHEGWSVLAVGARHRPPLAQRQQAQGAHSGATGAHKMD